MLDCVSPCIQKHRPLSPMAAFCRRLAPVFSVVLLCLCQEPLNVISSSGLSSSLYWGADKVLLLPTTTPAPLLCRTRFMRPKPAVELSFCGTGIQRLPAYHPSRQICPDTQKKRCAPESAPLYNFSLKYVHLQIFLSTDCGLSLSSALPFLS